MRSRRARWTGAVGLAAMVAVTGLVGGGPTPASADSSVDSSITMTKTVTRTHLVDGADVTAGTNTVSLTVSQTQNLRSQRVQVSWKGAHPTASLYTDQHDKSARFQEYPMVLLECRGTNASTTDPTLRLSPQTCWTQNPQERIVDDTGGTATGRGLFPAYRVDRYATAAARRAVDVPGDSCSSANVQRRIGFLGVDGHFYDGCPGQTPAEMTSLTTRDRPGNTTYAATSVDGTGTALFDIWNQNDNASLGCSDTVPCSLVAVPIMGISCDITATGLPAADRPSTEDPSDDQTADATKNCKATGQGRAGEFGNGSDNNIDVAVSGELWWSASNWRNRIVVPLHFAPQADCSPRAGTTSLDVYGSELLTQATAQWAPYICGAKGPYLFHHVQTGEPQARSLLDQGTVDAAFTTNVPDGGFATPTAVAPVGLTGFAVSYTIDDAKGRPYHTLKLNARLLAKLITESYTTNFARDDPDLLDNPTEIDTDPEFLALNPGLKGISISRAFAGEAAGAMLILSSDSDAIYAMSSYIYSDPAAKAWMEGQPDPWGMKVNPAYRIDYPFAQLSLPTYTWPLLDTWPVGPQYADRYKNGLPQLYRSDTNTCLADTQVPFLPLIASPVSRLQQIRQDLVISLESATIQCQHVNGDDQLGEKLVSAGVQAPGTRFMIGLTPLGDSDRYLLDTARLQSQTTTSPTTKFTDANGSTFVAPTANALVAAGDMLTPDPQQGIWTVPYDSLRTDPAGKLAYPGVMPIGLAVPTTGLPADEATSYAAFIRYLAGPGQVSGQNNGDLADGYAPVTADNGMGAMHDYALSVASAVAAQKGDVPALVPGAPAPATTSPPGTTRPTKPTSKPSSTPSSAAPTSAAATTTPATTVTAPAGAGASLAPAVGPDGTTPTIAAPTETAADQPSTAAQTGTVTGPGVGAAGLLVPLLLGLLVAGGVGSALTSRSAGWWKR